MPIDGLLPDLVAGLKEKHNLVLRAATGAGKTTRVPPAILNSQMGSGRIVMLEPRRVAARAAARRMAEQLGCPLGETVGYQVRFDRRFGESTRILVVTEGILVQMLQGDPFLESVDCLIFDEFHERNLHSDLSLAMSRKVQVEARPDLRIVVMSATLDPDPLVAWLGGDAECASFSSDGRLFPVETTYLPRPDARSLPILVREGVLATLPRTRGDLLVFLPGVGEIRRCREHLEPDARKHGFHIETLYGDLPPEQQDAVLRPSSKRRVILATNVAETSITIDGVTGVIDSGKVRTLRFDPAHGLDRLELGRISLASAEQRKGRAGRQEQGFCLRLWTEHDHRSLQEHELPEVQRVDLAAAALELTAWGETRLDQFPWFEPPPERSLQRSIELLVDLGACRRHQGGIEPTRLGRAMARLPVHPRLARLVVEGHRRGVLEKASILAALISERDVVFRPSSHRPVVAMASSPSDLLDRLDAILEQERSGYGETALGPVDRGRARNVLRVGRRLAQVAQKRLGRSPEKTASPGSGISPGKDPDQALLRCVLSAYPDRVARRREPGRRRALMVGGKGIRLAEMSTVQEARLFVCVELEGAKGSHRDGLARQASAVEADWLEPVETVEEARFDAERQRVVGFRTTYYRDLVLAEVETDPGADRAAEVLAKAAAEDLDRALALDDPTVAEFLTRVRCLGEWRPELGLPAFDRDDLIALLPHWVVGRRSFAELRRAPLLDVLRGSLDYPQLSALDELAPERVTVPSGSHIRLNYEVGKPPVLAVRIQEVFGWTDTPTVARGKVPILMHLLAPNMRPQQVTQDLASFWSNTYPEVRKELAGRYPKHAWPEDPLTAQAIRGARRRRPKG